MFPACSVSNMMFRGGSRAAATSKMELFVIIVNGFPLTIITKGSILDVPAALALHLVIFENFKAFAKSVCFCSRLLETFCKNSTRQ